MIVQSATIILYQETLLWWNLVQPLPILHLYMLNKINVVSREYYSLLSTINTNHFIIVMVDYTKSDIALQSWINNITLSLQNVCFMLTESQQSIEPRPSSESAIISLQVNTENNSTGKIQ